MRPLPALALSALLLTPAAQAAPLRLEFWHAMGGVQDTVAGYARDFNAAQSAYEIVPVAQGNYRELQPRLEAAIRAGKAPALAQVEFTQFPDLVAGGQLLDLSRAEAELPEALNRRLLPGGVALGTVWPGGPTACRGTSAYRC